MSGLVRDDVADHGAAHQGEISEQVERLVAHELVGEPEIAVFDAVVAHHDAVVFPGAAGEAVGLERLVLREETKRAGRRQVRGVGAGRENERDRLPPDGGVREVDRVRHTQVARRADLELPAARVGNGDDPRRGERNGKSVLRDEARGLERVEPGQRAAVENGHFGAVELHEDVVELRTDCGREQMFHGGHVAAPLAERRRMVETPGLLGDGRDERIDVGPVEDDAVVRGGRVQDDADVAARMQPDSRESHAPREGVL